MVDNAFFQKLLEVKIFPLNDEVDHINYVKDRMTEFMQQNNLKIASTTIGGSFGKNTMIRGRGEVDIVYEVSTRYNTSIFNELKQQLLEYAQAEFNKNEITPNKYGITILYRGISADVLLTFPFANPIIFLNNNEDHSQFKPYRIHFQKEFIIKRGSLFQNYIRLLKYWRNLGENKQWKPLENVKSFLLELLAAYVYDQSSNKSNYQNLLLEFFESIDGAISHETQIYFTDYYSRNDARRFNIWTVNDPADPSYNVVPNNLDLNTFRNYLQYSKNKALENDWETLFDFTL